MNMTSWSSWLVQKTSFHSICCLWLLLFNRLCRWRGCPCLYWSRLKNHWNDLWGNLRRNGRQKQPMRKIETWWNLEIPTKAERKTQLFGRMAQFFRCRGTKVPCNQRLAQVQVYATLRNHPLWHSRLSCVGATLRHLKERAAHNKNEGSRWFQMVSATIAGAMGGTCSRML